MSEPDKLSVIDDVLALLKGVETAQEEIIESMAKVQLKASEVDLEVVADGMARPFSNASSNIELVKKLVKDLEIERNRVRNEGS